MEFYNLLVNWRTKDKALLLLFILLLLGIRLWTLGSGIFMSHEDELYNGTITREILKGLKMPLFDYHSEPYAGGTLITGILAVPFFFIFGSSYFSLKLVALTLSLGSLIICFILLNKHFSLRVATIASLLFIFPPTLYTESSLITLGNHCESIFFSLLTLLIFFEIFFQQQRDFSEDKKRFYCLVFSLGLISGFSLYFSYIYFYTLLTCLFFWFIFDRKFFLKKYFLTYCLSFVIGFIPWLYYNFTHSFLGLSVMASRYIGEEQKNSFITKLIRYFSFDIPYILNFTCLKIPHIAIVRFFYYLILLTSFLFITWVNRKPFLKIIKALIFIKEYQSYSKEITKECFFVIAFIVFSLIYLSSDYITPSGNIEPYLSHRHLVPLFPIFFIVIASFLSRLTEEKKMIIKTLGYLVLISFVVLGFLSNINISNKSRITYFDLDGFSYRNLGLSAYRRFGMDFDKYLEQGEKIDSDYKHFYYLGLGDVISGRGLVWKKGFEEYERFEKMISKIDVRYQSYYYEGMGYKVGHNVIYNQYQMPVSDMNRIPEKKRYYAYIGMATVLQEERLPETNIHGLINAVDKKYRKFFYPLLGKDILIKNKGLKNAIAFAEGLKEGEKEGVYRGLGLALFNISAFDITKFNKMIESFPKSSRGFLYEAAGERIGFLNRQNVKKLQEILDPLSEFKKECIYRGIGKFAAERYGFDSKNYFDFLQGIPSNYRIYCYEGIGTQIAFRFGDIPEAANSIINKSLMSIRPFIQKGFAEEVNKKLKNLE